MLFFTEKEDRNSAQLNHQSIIVGFDAENECIIRAHVGYMNKIVVEN